jgi:hypothetical protein
MAARTRKYVESSGAPATGWTAGAGIGAGAFPGSTLDFSACAFGNALAFAEAFCSSGALLSAGTAPFPIHSQMTAAPIPNASTMARPDFNFPMSPFQTDPNDEAIGQRRNVDMGIIIPAR